MGCRNAQIVVFPGCAALVGFQTNNSVNIRDIGQVQVQVRHADGRRKAGFWIEENCRVDDRNYRSCACDKDGRELLRRFVFYLNVRGGGSLGVERCQFAGADDPRATVVFLGCVDRALIAGSTGSLEFCG